MVLHLSKLATTYSVGVARKYWKRSLYSYSWILRDQLFVFVGLEPWFFFGSKSTAFCFWPRPWLHVRDEKRRDRKTQRHSRYRRAGLEHACDAATKFKRSGWHMNKHLTDSQRLRDFNAGWRNRLDVLYRGLSMTQFLSWRRERTSTLLRLLNLTTNAASSTCPLSVELKVVSEHHRRRQMAVPSVGGQHDRGKFNIFTMFYQVYVQSSRYHTFHTTLTSIT